MWLYVGVRCPRKFTFCKAFLLSRNGVADVFTHRLNFDTIPNDNSKQNSFTYILIPPIPHFIIFTLINSKIKQIDDSGARGYNKHTKS